MARTGKEKKPKKAVKPAPSEEQARKAEEFAGLIADLVLEAMPERVDPSTRKRWKSLAGRAVLKKEFERIFSNLHLSIDEMEEMLYRPAKKSILEYAPEERTADIFPQIPVLPDLVLEDGQEAVAEGRFKSEEEQRSFLDAGPADERWTGGKKEDVMLEIPEADQTIAGAQDVIAGKEAAQEEIIPKPPDWITSNETEIIEQNIAGCEEAGREEEADKNSEPEQFLAEVERRRSFISMFFAKEVGEGHINMRDFAELKCPPRFMDLRDNSRFSELHVHELIVVPKGMTDLTLFRKCMEHMPCRSKRKDEYEFVWSIVSERSADEKSYAVWADRRLNADKELGGISADFLRRNKIPTMTFIERGLHDLYRLYCALEKRGIPFEEYNVHRFHEVTDNTFILYDESTICAGSRVNDPSRHLHPDNTVDYLWYNGCFEISVWEPKRTSEDPSKKERSAGKDPTDRRKTEKRKSHPKIMRRAHRVSVNSP